VKAPQYVIEKGVKIPPPNRRPPSPLVAVFKQMKIGDSVKVNVTSFDHSAKLAGIKITTRKIECCDNAVAFRVWRVK